MTIQFPRRISRGLSRRRFLSTAAATGVSTLALPYLSRAADRPLITHGVQSGDIGADGGVVWARGARPAPQIVGVGPPDTN
jgi:alkaline phosphatase D